MAPLPSSPRPRGWSPGRRGGWVPTGVVPAPAGVVPPACPPPPRSTRRPRARGGGPHARARLVELAQSSPRPRGWSPQDRRPQADDRVVPAPAGVVPRRRHPVRHPGRRPRARGGGPCPGSRAVAASASSPRPRGWSRVVVAEQLGEGVVPAPAGVVPTSCARPCAPRGRPRARGGGPAGRDDHQQGAGSSPRPRGWSPARCTRGGTVGVVPAPAGVVPARAGETSTGGRRPRARGGGPRREAERCADLGSSPRPRGWSHPGGPARPVQGVVPAPAGVVPGSAAGPRPPSCRPRARGGGPGVNVTPLHPPVSSPRPRGWSPLDLAAEVVGLVVPAPAGVVPRWCTG